MTPPAPPDFPLRPLRIPEGWSVSYNDFCDVPLDHPQAWSFAFKASLLMMRHARRGLMVDVGWYPDEDPAGGYRLVVLEGDHLGVERHRFETRDPQALIVALERLLDLINRGRLAEAIGDGSPAGS
jgi:hypothetical protein